MTYVTSGMLAGLVGLMFGYNWAGWISCISFACIPLSLPIYLVLMLTDAIEYSETDKENVIVASVSIAFILCMILNMWAYSPTHVLPSSMRL